MIQEESLICMGPLCKQNGLAYMVAFAFISSSAYQLFLFSFCLSVFLSLAYTLQCNAMQCNALVALAHWLQKSSWLVGQISCFFVFLSICLFVRLLDHLHHYHHHHHHHLIYCSYNQNSNHASIMSYLEEI